MFWLFLTCKYNKQKNLNIRNFNKPFLCNIQSLETWNLRDRDREETWNLRDRNSEKWVSRLVSRSRPSLETPSLLRLHHRQSWSHGKVDWKDASENYKWMIVQCATFSKSRDLQNIDKSVSDIRIRIRFPSESSFWISGSSCKLTIMPDIQLAN